MRKAIVAIVAVLTGIAPLARGDDRDNYRQMIAQQKQQQEIYIKRLELLPGKKKIHDLLRVESEGGKLVIKSPLFEPGAAEKLKNRQIRAEVDGFDGFCTLMVQPINKDSYYFTFSNMAYPDLQGMRNFQISMQPGYLQISRNFNSRTSNYTINLVQSQGRAMLGQNDGIQLTVYGGDNSGRVSVSVSIFEDDFVDLRRKHPQEVDEHLRPLLRDLKLENLFAVDPMTAWQVFSDEWKGSPDVAAQLRALLPALDVDDYRQREAARQAMKKLGSDAALVIYRMERTDLTPEQNCQLDAMLGDYSFLSRPQAQRLSTDVDFLLDCLYGDDAQVRTTALKHLREALGREIDFDPAADYDMRVARVETLRGELIPKKP